MTVVEHCSLDFDWAASGVTIAVGPHESQFFSILDLVVRSITAGVGFSHNNGPVSILGHSVVDSDILVGSSRVGIVIVDVLDYICCGLESKTIDGCISARPVVVGGYGSEGKLTSDGVHVAVVGTLEC